MRTRIGAIVAAVGLCAAVGTAAGRTPDAAATPGFSAAVVLGGDGTLTAPTSVAFAPDGHVLVAEAGGVVKAFDGLGDPTPQTVVDLSQQVFALGDRGLLGMALDPAFPTKPYLYVLFQRDAQTLGGTVPSWGDHCSPAANGCRTYARLLRLTLDANFVAGAQKLLVDAWCNGFNHGAGALRFGPDGMLYASAGDGGYYTTTDYGQLGAPANACGDPPSAAGTALTLPTAEGGSLRAQDVRTDGDPADLDGAIIRVNPNTGVGPTGNPFGASLDANKRRVIAYGLRNPFRFTFRPGTDEIWLGDAGWNTYEEIDRIIDANDKRAENFGWPCHEGPLPQPQWSALGLDLCTSLYAAGTAKSPAFSYLDDTPMKTGDPCPTANSAPAGLAFNSGNAYPSAYAGALFFADYSRKCLWVAPANPTTGLPQFGKRALVVNLAPGAPVDVVAGPGGSLYVVDIVRGAILQLQYG